MGPSGSLPSINQIGPPVINILIREQPFHHPTPLLVHCPRRGRRVPFTEPSIIIGHRDVEVTPPDGRSTCVIGVLADESLSCWESGSRLLWPSPLWTAYLSSMTFGEPGERLSRSKASEMCTCILLLPPPINMCMGVNVRKLKQKICIYYWKLDLFTQTSMIYALSLNSVSVINCTLHILHHIYQHQNCHRIWEWEQISYYMYDRGMEGNSRRSLRLFFSTHCVSFHIIIIQ